MTEYEKKKSPSQRETDTQWGRVTAFQTKWTKKHQAQIPVNDLIIKKKKKNQIYYSRGKWITYKETNNLVFNLSSTTLNSWIL